jgi:hypothetical protein
LPATGNAGAIKRGTSCALALLVLLSAAFAAYEVSGSGGYLRPALYAAFPWIAGFAIAAMSAGLQKLRGRPGDYLAHATWATAIMLAVVFVAHWHAAI